MTESAFFRALNSCVEPAVRAGAGSPGLVPAGLIVLETTGARSGLARPVPLAATVLEGCFFVSTVRSRSLWVRNLRANSSLRYWVGGQEHEGRALVFAPGEPPPDSAELPPLVRIATANLRPLAAVLGCTFAVIVPVPPGPPKSAAKKT